jgi:ankyrin repeat protein
VEVVKSLLARADFDPNIVATAPGDYGWNYEWNYEANYQRNYEANYALGDAAHRGDIDVMKLLLDHPAVDPNFAGRPGGSTPLIQFPDVVKLLLDQEYIDINYQKNSGALSTALIKTAAYNWLESTKLLLGRDDIDVNISNSTGLTALHCACLNNGSLKVVNLLLERDDIDLNPRDIEWETPLSLACCNKNDQSIPIIRSLLSHHDTDPNILNSNGVANFMKYRYRSYMDSCRADEIESLLRNAGAR